jgi:hypothetical protein
VIGIWSYTDDRTAVAQKISQGEESSVAVTLAEAVAQVRSFAEMPVTSLTVADEQPSLLAATGESAA